MTFEKKGVVLNLGAGGAWDDVLVDSSTVVVRDGQVWLYYTGYDGSNYRIGLAVSKDGLTFEKKGIVLDLGAGGAWDDVRVYYPTVAVRDGRVWLYYTGYDGSNYRTGLAVSKDGLTFEKKGIVLDLGAGGAWDDVLVYSSTVAVRDGRVWLYYTGYDGSKYRTGLAVSKD
ncbi:MAG: hypothetical protein PHF64_11450, partial [Methanoregula sp.]|nr:hypothetical protein [Methanoregula sp.]